VKSRKSLVVTPIALSSFERGINRIQVESTNLFGLHGHVSSEVLRWSSRMRHVITGIVLCVCVCVCVCVCTRGPPPKESCPLSHESASTFIVVR
jgi:hypothetical protein